MHSTEFIILEIKSFTHKTLQILHTSGMTKEVKSKTWSPFEFSINGEYFIFRKIRFWNFLFQI